MPRKRNGRSAKIEEICRKSSGKESETEGSFRKSKTRRTIGKWGKADEEGRHVTPLINCPLKWKPSKGKRND